MIFKKALIMEVGHTQNAFFITKDMILNSMDTFQGTPIVYNNKQILKDYTDDDSLNKFNSEYAIGFVRSNVELINNNVYADVFIQDKHIDKWKGKYDNWCVQLNDDKTRFALISIECF